MLSINGVCAGPILRFHLSGTDPMASAEREPITGSWGQSPQRGPGAEPLVRGQSPPEAESLFSFSASNEIGKINQIHCEFD